METKLRTEYRRQFTRKCNTFEEIMASLPSKEAEIQQVITAYKSVKEYREQLEKLDKIICEQILKDSEEEDLQKEFDDAEKYKERWLLVETKYEIFMNKQKQNPEHVNNNKHTAKNNLRLPMLEIPKFDGRLETWLPFWGQFKKIHEDAHLDPEDKFGYLLQSINPGTDARQLVESYPISPENYPKCIEHLKSRYAREDLQTQLYVRELLSLIMQREKHTNLTTLYDKLSAQLRSLETLGVTKKNAAFILPMVESALPEECLKAWQRMGKHDNDMETELNNLLSFLHTEVEHHQRIEMARMNFNKEEYKESLPTASCLFTAKKTDQKTLLCIWCDKENHASLECYKLQKLTVEQRREVIQKKRACSVCLKRGHHFKNCRSFIKCLICGKKHSTVLCWSPKQDQKPSDEPKKESTSTTATASAELQSTTATASSVKKSTTTLLQAVRVTIEHNGKKIPIRAVFDNGSQRTYVQDKLMKKLQIPICGQERLGHTLFGGNEMESKNYNLFNVKINSLDGSYSTQIEALGQDILCNNIPKYNVKALSNFAEIFKTNLIHLTDNDDPSDEVGLLIGADISGKFLTGQMIPLDDNGLVVVRTKLGWTLQGKQVSVNANNIVTTLFCSNLNNDLTGYWSLETLGIQDPAELKTKEAAADEVMTAFEETIRINEEDRYEVRLPFKTGQEDLLPNYNIARKRLDTMTQKIISSGIFHKYHGVFQEWLNLGIIERVPDSEIDHDKGHYLPHRAVLKESSLTCAIRPVFDAAAKDKNGLCLNACLEKGLNLIDRIPNLLIGFRTGAIGVTADIQRAFLQISIPQDDRNYLKFLWWENESLQNIITYRHCRLVFGLTSSPFLLAATLMHHLNNTSGACAELLNRSWYVDNCLTSFDTEAETRKFIEEAKQIMQAAKFNLRMWVTSPMTINEAGKDEISVLGINWDTVADQLHCNTVNLPAVEDIKRVTKRELLSLTQRVYDPIGYTSPVMLVPKLIMQETWRRDLPWDDTLLSDLMKKFLEWYKELTYLNNCRIPRRLTAENLKERTENWADLASRGCTAKTLRDCRWWEGPAWLRLAPEQWPHSEVSVDECEVQAETKRTVCSTQVCVNGNLLERLQNYFSKYTKIVRTVAWILRFIHNMKNSTNKKKGEITFNEYSKAEKSVIRFIQESSKEYLGKECKNLTKFTDAEGLLKIKTKLTLSDFPELIRTPYLLPAKNPVVKLLVRQRHEQMQHAGTDQLIVDLRARFWIIGVRRLVRSVIHNCVVCKRYRSKPAQAPTAPLPLERITSAASFQNCGVDLAGPLILRNGEKCWIVIYTCAVYRAVHLELTLSLSTEAFIMTMRRFIARRCRPELMLSDQGTNFHGTKNLINSLDWEEVQRHSTIRRIQWKMNAPTAAWWGGFWERLIRLMKDLLKRIIGRASLTYEEMQTTLCECEAVMNGRPLTYVNSDTDDCLEPLTPAHFLQPISQPTMEVCDFNQIDSNSLNSRVKYIQEIRAQFNERFKTEYLTSLIQRGKENNVNIKVGDVVLIETTDKKIRWPLGVVQKLITGKDGVGRTAEVKTALGTKIRPIQRLFNLEVSTEPTGNILPVLRPSSPINVQQAEQPAETSVADTSTVNQEQANYSDDAAQIPQSSRCGRQVKIPSKFNIYHRY